MIRVRKFFLILLVIIIGSFPFVDSVQAQRTLAAACRYDPAQEEHWRRLYGWEVGGEPNYSPSPAYNARLGLLVRELCARHGILDRMPRYIKPGPLAINKRIAERLFLKTYDLELEQAKDYRIWAYRKAAWAIEDTLQDLGLIYQQMGRKGLESIQDVGPKLAEVVEALIRQWA